MESNRILLGNCQKVLADVPDNQVDQLVTDPPYGYSFMGKNWDKAVPRVAIWKECLRVLKPGAFAFVMSSPRADVLSHMIVNLSDAGFRTDFTPIYWAYASGFPKATNISKSVDKRILQVRFFDEIREYLQFWLSSSKLSFKEINEKLGFATNGSGMAGHWFANITQQTLPTKSDWFRLKELLQFDDKYDAIYNSLADGAERPIIGAAKNWGAATESLGIGGKEWAVTKSASKEAKALDGSFGGFQPKPAVEVIIVAMKPLSEKTFVDQALKNQKGITWLDDCRIPFQSDADAEQAHDNALGPVERSVTTKAIYEGGKQNGGFADTFNDKGRFPANLLVSDNCLDDGTIHVSGHMESIAKGDPTNQNCYGKMYERPVYAEGDEGSFSRFFDLDAWFTKQAKKLPAEAQKTFPFLVVPKASKEERNKNLERLPKVKKHAASGDDHVINEICPIHHKTLCPCGWRSKPVANFHPTVKPLQLMSYLITLGSRPNDLVLDPFCGSGTTCLAAKMLGRRFLGIELNKDYHTLAETRVGNHRTLFEFSVA